MPFGTVLIVDDEAAVSMLLREHLKRAGFDASVAYTFTEAVKELGRRKFDFVILDMQLEKRSGVEVLEFIGKQAGLNRATPVVAMSGKFKVETVEKIRDKVCTVMVKPLDFGKIVTKLKQLAAEPRKSA